MNRTQSNSIPTNGERAGATVVATATDALPRWLWTAGEVAAVLGVSEDCIRNLHRVGLLVGVKIGRHLRWRPGDVRRFVESLGEGGRR